MLTSVNILTYILDDDEEMHDVLKQILEDNHIPKGMYQIHSDPEKFISQLNSDINICVIDHRLNKGYTGLDILLEVKKKNEDSYVIIITGQENYKIVARYLREGADDYIDKNEDDYLDEFISSIKKGFEKATVRIEKAKERMQFRLEMEKRNSQTTELINQLKTG